MMYGDMVPRGTPPSTNIPMLIIVGLFVGIIGGLAVDVTGVAMASAVSFFEHHVSISLNAR